MSEIVVSVVGEAGSGQLSLPDDVPLGVLVGELARYCPPDTRDAPAVEAGGRPLDLDAPLSAAGVSDGAELRVTPRAQPEPSGVELGIVVVGPSGERRPLRVAADAPVRSLAARLGAAVGAAAVADVRLGDGKIVPPSSSLAALGVRTGDVVVVRAVGDPVRGHVVASASRRRWERRRWVAVAAAVALAAAGGAAVGAGVAGGPSTSGATAGLQAAAAAWVAAVPYRAPAWAGVGRTLGRAGALPISPEPTATWHDGNETGRSWIVSAPGHQPWGLEAVAYAGKLGYDPTPSGLPFGTGQAPPASGKVEGHGPVPPAVAAWLSQVWGAKGSLTALVGMGASGPLRVLTVYRPAAGGLVWRVQVPLDSVAPGAPLGVARSQVATDLAAVRSAGQLAAAAASEVSAGQAALSAAQTANPPDPAAVTAAQNAVTAVQQKAQAFQTALSQAQTTLTAAEGRARGLAEVSAVGTYDLWVRDSRVVGWSPAGYGTGGNR
ncbi:MAG: hypothetical protein M0Z30_16015 [Actinomycetota bacterium]|nr:hypothetical protein [Actinomycetota bacterium]